ncbi:MAG: hypothetical protein WA705_00485 [Candidatus Ozemobacteraceae bacterium]
MEYRNNRSKIPLPLGFILFLFAWLLAAPCAAAVPFDEEAEVKVDGKAAQQSSGQKAETRIVVPSVWDGLEPQKNFLMSAFGVTSKNDDAEWKASELNTANEVMADLPVIFRSATKGLVRVESGSSDQVAGYVNMNEAPVIYMTNAGANYKVFPGYLVHEMTHCFQMAQPKLLEAWEDTFWDSGFFGGSPKTPSVSAYGNSSAKEDMAESVRIYYMNGSSLKSSSPERYQFIKDKLMQGKEFGERD